MLSEQTYRRIITLTLYVSYYFRNLAQGSVKSQQGMVVGVLARRLVQQVNGDGLECGRVRIREFSGFGPSTTLATGHRA